MTNQKTPDTQHAVSASEFAEAIGRALIAWQDIEAASAKLFACLVAAQNSDAAVAAFYSVNGMGQRLSMMKSALRFLGSVPELDERLDDITDVLDRIGAELKLRNRLSHSAVKETFTGSGYSFALEMPEAAWGGKAKDRRLEFPAIQAAEGQFKQLAGGIGALAADLAEALGINLRTSVPV